MNINLACGGIYVTEVGWLNFDYVSRNSAVQRANLLDRLPLANTTADLVYSSHFLEHIPREQVVPFLQECWRVLKPGGIIRLVLPDLENLCRAYLSYRDHAEHHKADFVVLELLDQFSRRQTGGELGRYYQRLKADPKVNFSCMAFVRERNGEDFMTRPPTSSSLYVILQRLLAFLERLWIRAVIQMLPRAFREQNVSLASIGECHQWLYDIHSMQQLLRASGFVAIERCTASTSRYPDFPFYPLDLAADGLPRKGDESMYVEALKPY